jgi:hypothetical protein
MPRLVASAPADRPFPFEPAPACGDEGVDAEEGAQPDHWLMSEDIHHRRGTPRAML